MASKAHEIAEFGAVLGREAPDLSPYAVGVLATKLIRLGKRTDNLAVAYYNGEMQTEEYTRKQEAIKAKVEALADGLLMRDGWGCKVGGDPRGCCLKLIVPTGYANDFGHEAVCVPY